jgi:DNA-binding response OmpR family regulator
VSAPKAPEGQRRRILFAEDDAAIATLVRRVLGQHYDVSHASTGAIALELARVEPGPDLILLDVMLPGLDGFAVAAKIRTMPRLKRVPILFVTARGSPADVIRGIQVGARHYIQKPFSIDDLLSKVKKALGE